MIIEKHYECMKDACSALSFVNMQVSQELFEQFV